VLFSRHFKRKKHIPTLRYHFQAHSLGYADTDHYHYGF